jgi:hypothetical protein
MDTKLFVAILVVVTIGILATIIKQNYAISDLRVKVFRLEGKVKVLEETAVRRGKDGRFLRRSTDIPAVSE